MGRLDVRICAARNLPDTQMVGMPDPYVKISLENQHHKTSVCQDTLNPKWEEVFKFIVADENSSQLKIEVWNSNVTSDDFMGQYTLSLSGLTKAVVKDEWLLLQQCKSNAEIHVRILAVDFGKDPLPGQTVAQALQGMATAAPVVLAPGQVLPGYGAPAAIPVAVAPVAVAPAPYPAPQAAYAPPAQPAYAPPQPAYAPPQPAYAPPQPGYPPQQTAYPPQQPGYPPQQPGYPPQQPGYPPQQVGYPPQQPGYPPQQPGYPPQTGYPQPGYPMAAPGYPPQQPGYPPQQPGYPPQQAGFQSYGY